MLTFPHKSIELNLGGEMSWYEARAQCAITFFWNRNLGEYYESTFAWKQSLLVMFIGGRSFVTSHNARR